ncbi:acrB/AcrD/AcrF family protein, partial [Vibrio parahaemolyticus V-223/04]
SSNWITGANVKTLSYTNAH